MIVGAGSVGAGWGNGKATAVRFAQEGASVFAVDIRHDAAEETRAIIENEGGVCVSHDADVTRSEQVRDMVQACEERFGRIDVLVNNAGGAAPSPALHLDLHDLEATFHFNVGTAFQLSKLCAPHLAKEGGAIVNVSSAMARLVDPGFVAYGTAKAALSHMTRLLACEWAPQIRVNALAVGATVTEALGSFLKAMPEMQRQMTAMTPLGRLGTPEDIALAVLYLASPAGSWITGKVFEVDGGTVASNWPVKMASGL